MASVLKFFTKLYFKTLILLLTSVLTYKIFYYWFIPNNSLIQPVHFQHDVSCISKTTQFDLKTVFNCNFSYYEIPYEQYRNFFSRSQSYNFVLQLELPDSDVNNNIGMFMVSLNLYDYADQLLLKVSRPALLPYTSTILRHFKLLFFIWFYLFGYMQEVHVLRLPLIDDSIHWNDFTNVGKISIVIETHRPIEIIPNSKLLITANLKSIFYFMYHWYYLTLFVCTLFISFFILITKLYLFLKQMHKNQTESNLNEANECNGGGDNSIQLPQLTQ